MRRLLLADPAKALTADVDCEYQTDVQAVWVLRSCWAVKALTLLRLRTEEMVTADCRSTDRTAEMVATLLQAPTTLGRHCSAATEAPALRSGCANVAWHSLSCDTGCLVLARERVAGNLRRVVVANVSVPREAGTLHIADAAMAPDVLGSHIDLAVGYTAAAAAETSVERSWATASTMAVAETAGSPHRESDMHMDLQGRLWRSPGSRAGRTLMRQTGRAGIASPRHSSEGCTAESASAAPARHSLPDCTGTAAGLGKPAGGETAGSCPGMFEPALHTRTALGTAAAAAAAARSRPVHLAAAHIGRSDRSRSVAGAEEVAAVGGRIGLGCCNCTTCCQT